MGRRIPLAAVLCTVALAGCFVTSTTTSGIGYPAGPSLEKFGLRERCPEGGDCTQRAMDAIEAALGRLGPELVNPPITSPGGAPAAEPVPPDRLYVEITVDPMLEWQAATGAAGSGSAFRVDLTDDRPYVVVAPRLSFRLNDADAAAIRDALFLAR
jgi:hypothetical protein